MKRLITIALISIYITSFTEVHQLLRLPLLIEHYIEHKKLTGNITFIEFLTLHYNSQAAHDDKDMQLPFKDCGHCIAVTTGVIPSLKIELKDAVLDCCIKTYFSFYNKMIPASHLTEIWQPPKA